MSADYSLYTEVRIDGKWQTLNARVLNAKTHELELSETYHSSSRSYFAESLNKIREIGFPVPIEDISQDIRKSNSWTESGDVVPIYGCSLSSLRKCVPNPAEHECHGFVTKDEVFGVEHGLIDEPFSSLSIDEYHALDEEEKKAYQYYEWNTADGWYNTFCDILAHIKWQLQDWYDINYFLPDDEDIRLVLLCG